MKNDDFTKKLLNMGAAWHNVMALYGRAMCSAQILAGCGKTNVSQSII
jgi:hypothetical protein